MVSFGQLFCKHISDELCRRCRETVRVVGFKVLQICTYILNQLRISSTIVFILPSCLNFAAVIYIVPDAVYVGVVVTEPVFGTATGIFDDHFASAAGSGRRLRFSQMCTVYGSTCLDKIKRLLNNNLFVTRISKFYIIYRIVA